MKALKFLGIALLLLAAVLLGGGLLLPRSFHLERSTVVNAPPDKPFALVAQPSRWKDWTVWNQRDPAMQIEYFGPASGAGAGWAWKSASEGDGRMTLTQVDPPKRVAYDLYFPDFDTTSTGDLSFVPEGAGTRVTWTMNGDMGPNPLWRWIGLFMGDMAGKDFDAGLARLKTLAEAP